jgi:amidase
LEVADATRSGSISCREVTAAVVARMREANPPLNAITLDLGDNALAAAAKHDERRAAGEAPGPLFGVPVTIKDNIDVRGQRTPNGIPALVNVVAPDDSPVVKNLVDAGSIIIGRTNTPEFSMRATTNNPLYGLTRNPWNHGVSCGGSSGGAGAAVATGMGALGHGNDIGGSIRFPALHCGVAGLKPSQGRVPAFVPTAAAERPVLSSLMSVQGPLARCVSDLRLAIGAMARRDPRDPWWVPAPLDGPTAALRVGLIDGVPGLTTAPVVKEALGIAVRALESAGYEVRPVQPPSLAESRDLALRILVTDIQHQMLPIVDQHGSDQIKWYFGVMFKLARPYREVGDYLDALMTRSSLLRKWLLLLDDYPIILAPQQIGPLMEVDEDMKSAERIEELWMGFAPSITVNLLGLPSVFVPTGLANDLPMGVQLIGSRYREDLCIAAGEAIERQVGTLVEKLWNR